MFTSLSKRRIGKAGIILLPVIALGMELVACASVPPVPTDALQAADTAIKQADDARVGDFAPAALSSARDKLSAAHAMADKATHDKDATEMNQARTLADESRSDTELASAQAQEARAKAANKDQQQSNDTLQQELQRKSGS